MTTFPSGDTEPGYTGPPDTSGPTGSPGSGSYEVRHETAAYDPAPYGQAPYGAPYEQAPTHPAPAPYAPQPQPGYPAAPGYGPGAPVAMAYPGPYGGYGPPRRNGPPRPGGATAAAVLHFVQGGIVLISSLYLLFALSVIGAVTDTTQTEFTIVTVLQLASAGLLIAGGVTLLSGNSLVLSYVGGAVQLALVVYWAVRIASFTSGELDEVFPGFAIMSVFFAVMPIIALSLSATTGVRRWAAEKAALGKS